MEKYCVFGYILDLKFSYSDFSGGDLVFWVILMLLEATLSKSMSHWVMEVPVLLRYDQVSITKTFPTI